MPLTMALLVFRAVPSTLSVQLLMAPSSMALKTKMMVVFVVLVLFAGETSVTTGGVVSMVKLNVALIPRLFAVSVQLMSHVCAPVASGP